MDKKDTKLTDVTSLADEKAKDSSVPIPTKEEMDAIALRDYNVGLITLHRDLKLAIKGKRGKITARGLLRVLVALLQFPEPDLKVDLRNDTEIKAFGIGQRVQLSRFYLMMDSLNKKTKKNKKKNKQEEKKNESDKKG